MNCTTKTDLIQSIILQVWFHDEEINKMCSTLVDSMPNCVCELIKNKGHFFILLAKNIPKLGKGLPLARAWEN